MEAVAIAAIDFANIYYRNKGEDMFMYGDMLGGVYVFKKVY